jgi:hypothetical protein
MLSPPVSTMYEWVEEAVDGGVGNGFGHELVEAGGVKVAGDGQAAPVWVCSLIWPQFGFSCSFVWPHQVRALRAPHIRELRAQVRRQPIDHPGA